MTSRPLSARHLRDLALLRRVRDRIDREQAQPLDVEALARGGYDKRDAAVRGQAGDETGQESRSAGAEPCLAWPP